MKTLVDAANGKGPTMIGVFETSTKEAMKRARMAADIGHRHRFITDQPASLPAADGRRVDTHYRLVNDNADIGLLFYSTPLVRHALRDQTATHGEACKNRERSGSEMVLRRTSEIREHD